MRRLLTEIADSETPPIQGIPEHDLELTKKSRFGQERSHAPNITALASAIPFGNRYLAENTNWYGSKAIATRSCNTSISRNTFLAVNVSTNNCDATKSVAGKYSRQDTSHARPFLQPHKVFVVV